MRLKMNKQFWVNLLVDVLATRTPRGDLINFLPSPLRQKCRENLKARTFPFATLTSKTKVYKTYSAWELIKGEQK